MNSLSEQITTVAKQRDEAAMADYRRLIPLAEHTPGDLAELEAACRLLAIDSAMVEADQSALREAAELVAQIGASATTIGTAKQELAALEVEGLKAMDRTERATAREKLADADRRWRDAANAEQVARKALESLRANRHRVAPLLPSTPPELPVERTEDIAPIRQALEAGAVSVCGSPGTQARYLRGRGWKMNETNGWRDPSDGTSTIFARALERQTRRDLESAMTLLERFGSFSAMH